MYFYICICHKLVLIIDLQHCSQRPDATTNIKGQITLYKCYRKKNNDERQFTPSLLLHLPLAHT